MCSGGDDIFRIDEEEELLRDPSDTLLLAVDSGNSSSVFDFNQNFYFLMKHF